MVSVTPTRMHVCMIFSIRFTRSRPFLYAFTVSELHILQHCLIKCMSCRNQGILLLSLSLPLRRPFSDQTVSSARISATHNMYTNFILCILFQCSIASIFRCAETFECMQTNRTNCSENDDVVGDDKDSLSVWHAVRNGANCC